MSKAKICPICHRKIIASEFEWHLQHGHDIGGQLDKSAQSNDFDDGIVTVDYLQPNLDASKDIGYPCREGGAYGSYSSIDGFDDESHS